MGVETYGVSTDTHFTHKAWHDTSETIGKIKFPMIGDPTGTITRNFGVMIEEAGLAERGTFVIDPQGKIQIIEINAGGIGRDAAELLRKVTAAQYVASHPGEVCPAKWKEGDATLAPSLDLVAHVTLLEFDSKLRADAVLQAKLTNLPNVTAIVSAQTTEVTGDGAKANGITYRDRVSGEAKHVELEGIFVHIGLLPNTDWLKGTVALSPRGEIEVDARSQTSVPGSSRRATQPPCPTSRSSLPWAKAPKHRCSPSTT